MMGHRQVEQAALFYDFSLEKHIPAGNSQAGAHLMATITTVRDDESAEAHSIGGL
jgi:hypothetical protein